MLVRSWKAALVLTVSLTAMTAQVSRAQEPSKAQDGLHSRPEAEAKAEPGDAAKRQPGVETRAVELNLMIAGLGRDGCDIEVRPGTRSCRFQPQVLHIASHGKASLNIREVEFRGADRNCSFAITVRESGQVPRTIYRAFRISPKVDPAHPAAPPSFTCFMTSPSKLAGLERPDRARR
jgi:hypothetical protein